MVKNAFFFLYKHTHTHQEGSEPHEPVETVVIGRDETWPTSDGSRFTLELHLQPASVLPVGTVECSLQHNLSSLSSDAVSGERE